MKKEFDIVKGIKARLLCLLMVLCMVSPVVLSIPAYAAYSEDRSGAEEAYELYKSGYTIANDDWILSMNPSVDPPTDYDQTSFIYNWPKIRAYIYQNGEDSFSSLSFADQAYQMYVATRAVIGNGWKPAETPDPVEPSNPSTSDTEDTDWNSWINPLEVPENYAAKNTVEQGAGILLLVCKWFGGAAVIIGLAMLILAMKDERPEPKEKAIHIFFAGLVLLSIMSILQAMGVIS